MGGQNIRPKGKEAKEMNKMLEQTYIKPQGQNRYPLGRDGLRRLAIKAGAVRRFGKLILYNTELIDAYLEKECKEDCADD